MKILFTIAALLCVLSISHAQNWESIITDPNGDGYNGSLADGTELEFYQDTISDSLFFRIHIPNLNANMAAAIGCNLMFNIDGAGSTFNFWGNQNTQPYHRLVTTWVTGNPPSSYAGTIGIADVVGVNASNYTNLSSNNIDIEVDVNHQWIALALKREDLISNDHFDDESMQVGIAAAVGSNQAWNDDLFGGSAEITVYGPSIPGDDPDTTGGDNPWPVGVEDVRTPSFQIEKRAHSVRLSGHAVKEVRAFDLVGRPIEIEWSSNSLDQTQITYDGHSGIIIFSILLNTGEMYSLKTLTE